jgi:hypothetical protein
MPASQVAFSVPLGSILLGLVYFSFLSPQRMQALHCLQVLPLIYLLHWVMLLKHLVIVVKDLLTHIHHCLGIALSISLSHVLLRDWFHLSHSSSTSPAPLPTWIPFQTFHGMFCAILGKRGKWTQLLTSSSQHSSQWPQEWRISSLSSLVSGTMILEKQRSVALESVGGWQKWLMGCWPDLKKD